MSGLGARAPSLLSRESPGPARALAGALAVLLAACNTSSRPLDAPPAPERASAQKPESAPERPFVSSSARPATLAPAHAAAAPSGGSLPPAPGRARIASDRFVRVSGARFTRNGQPLPVMGMNYWSAASECRTEAGRARVARELDRLSAAGVNVLRILALSEGPDSEPWRIRPSLQPEPGRFTPEGLAGLDWLMGELARRDMSAVFILTNFWFWSGGMAQYLSWARGVPIPYPHPERGDGWARYEDFTAEFFSDERAQALFERAVRAVVPRYRDSPAVFAWELANEPHPRRNVSAFLAWIDEAARLVRALAPDHLVTTGSEGNTPAPEITGLDVARDHASDAIDFVSIHVWPENWGWTRAGAREAPFAEVSARVRRYLDAHARAAATLGKPALLLETGMPRDAGGFAATAPVGARDRYLEFVFGATLESLERGGALAGAFPWAWSGEATPRAPGVVAESTPYTGDPPHERQGWYSIYASDASTLALIERYASRLRGATR